MKDYLRYKGIREEALLKFTDAEEQKFFTEN